MPRSPFSYSDIAIDLGSSSTRVFVKGRGIVINEPSVVALREDGKRVVAIGEDAEEIVNRSGEKVRMECPVAGGKIIDLETAQLMLQWFVNKAIGTIRLKPRVIGTKPTGQTRMEEIVLQRTLESIDGRRLAMVEQIVAAGMGAGLPVYEPQGSLIADIGAGKTEVALLSMGGIVVSFAQEAGGMRIDEEIAACIRREYAMVITTRAAEQIKQDLIDVRPEENRGRKAVVRGRDIATGMPTTQDVALEKVCAAIRGVLDEICEAIRRVLSRTPPELCKDVLKGGITLCGGTSLLPKLDIVVSEVFGIPTHTAAAAGDCAVLGAGYIAEHFDVFSSAYQKGDK